MQGQDILQRELSVIEILKHSFAVIKKNMKLILSILLIIYLPLYTVLRFLKFNLTAYSVVFNIIDFFAGTLTVALVTYFTAKSLWGKEPEYGSKLFKLSIKKLPLLICIGLILFILIAVLSAILITPGLIFFIFTSFSTYAAVLSGKKLFPAMRYSYRTVKGSFWKVALFKCLFLIPTLSNILITYKLARALFGIQNQVASIFIGLLNEFLIIIVFVIDVVLYINLEQVKAGKVADHTGIENDKSDSDINQSLEVKPVNKYTKPNYPLKEEITPDNLVDGNYSSSRRKWSIPQYAYAVIIMISLSIAAWKEMHFSQRDIEEYKRTLIDNNPRSGALYIHANVTSGLMVSTPSIEQLKIPLSNVFFIENSKSIGKAYWIINTMPDSELKFRIDELLRIYEIYYW